MPYNTTNYNDQRYNIDGVVYSTLLSDSITPSEFDLAQATKALSDSLSAVDVAIFSSELSILDFLFSDDIIQIQVTNKALNDVVRIADWLSVRRYPQRSEWGD